MTVKNRDLAAALLEVFRSPNVADSNFEAANVVDVIDGQARSARRIADAITPGGAANGKDAAGGTVGSLTEAVMGITAGLVKIADAIGDLADAIRERKRAP